MRAPRALCDTRDNVPGCNCNTERKCPTNQARHLKCVQSQYCPDLGNDFQNKRDNSPDCRACNSGYYFLPSSDVFLLQSHQSVGGPDIPQWTKIPDPNCDPSTTGTFSNSVSICGLIKVPAPPIPGPKKQVCQHCPIHTIANPQYIANGGPRCFYWCEDAYNKMYQAETLSEEQRKFTLPRLVNSGGNLIIKDTDIALFPGSGLDGYMLQIQHSVVRFERADDVENWKTVEAVKYGEYGRYISENNVDFYQILRLPPPPRQCKQCAAGKSMFIVSCDGVGDPDGPSVEAQCYPMNRQIQALKVEFAGKLQSARRDEISWLNVGAFIDFKVGVCRDCPAGTYFSPDFLLGLNEADLAKPVKDYLGNDAWTLRQLRCIPCEYGKFTSGLGKTECDHCPEYQHVLHADVDVEIRTKADYEKTELKKVPILKSCSGCPVGTEYYANSMAVKKDTRCSSLNTAQGSFTVLVLGQRRDLQIPTVVSLCCRPCFLNLYRSDIKARFCVSGRSVNPTLAPYGQVAPMECIEGQQKKFCVESKDWNKANPRVSPCTTEGSSSDTDWATCVACLKTERPIKVGTNHECVLCNQDASGEYFDNRMCQTCESCSILTPEFTLEKFEWEKSTEYTTVLELWKQTDEIRFRWQDRWRYKNVSVTCVPLTRRVMEWHATAQTITVKGVDHYKVDANTEQKRDGMLFTEKSVAIFHAMQYDKIVDGKTICVYRPCRYFCEDLFYQYSNGCGPNEDPWVAKKISEVVELLSMSALKTKLVSSGVAMAGGLKDYVIVPQGKCQLCQECDPGQYNPDCNKWAVYVDPKGECKTCLSSCGAGQFLWHERGLRGCAPGVATTGKVQVLTDYACKACPTWIRRNGGMYAVLGCGNKATFGYHTPDPVKGNIDVDFTVSQVNEKILKDKFDPERQDVDWKFKPFVYAIDYCPDGYYFRAEKSGCSFDSGSYVLEPGQVIEHGIDAYNRDCCVICDDCDPAKEKRVQNKWRECDGSTLSDTQKEHCVEKCHTGYYDNKQTGSAGACIPCTRCKDP